MSTGLQYIIGLRLSPDRSSPEWHAVWFEDGDGRNRLATRDGRIQWFSTLEGARRFSEQRAGEEVPFDAVCDVPGALHALESQRDDGSLVLLFLNLLDDMLETVGDQVPLAHQEVLDDLVKALTEGDQLTVAAGRVGDSRAVIEAVLAGLGRLLVHSDFHC